MITQVDKIGHYGFRYRIISSNLNATQQKEYVKTLMHNDIFFMLRGQLKISWNRHKNVQVGAGELFFLPRGAEVSAEIMDGEIEFISVRLMHDIDNTTPFLGLMKVSEGNFLHQNLPFPKLPIKDVLMHFITSMKRYTEDNVDNPQLYSAKLYELYAIFINYYTKQECFNLFHPILKRNLKFRAFILENYNVNISIEDLVKKANMSRSTFDRKFKDSFGMTPHRWIELQVRMIIMRKVSEPNVTVKDMMYEVGVNNPSQFTQLCKRLFGKCPSDLIKH